MWVRPLSVVPFVFATLGSLSSILENLLAESSRVARWTPSAERCYRGHAASARNHLDISSAPRDVEEMPRARGVPDSTRSASNEQSGSPTPSSREVLQYSRERANKKLDAIRVFPRRCRELHGLAAAEQGENTCKHFTDSHLKTMTRFWPCLSDMCHIGLPAYIWARQPRAVRCFRGDAASVPRAAWSSVLGGAIV